jgi:hypothetical protein
VDAEGGNMKADHTTPTTIDEYIAAFSPEVRSILERIRVTIRKAAPDAEETISYQMPAFISKAIWFTSAPSRSTSASTPGTGRETQA